VPTIDGYDYAAEDTMLVAEPAQLRAMADPFRVQLVQLLREPRTFDAGDLRRARGAEGNRRPPPEVLEAAGLIHVVRTRKVRALTEKFYGRTARLFSTRPRIPQTAGRFLPSPSVKPRARSIWRRW
jgi:hypothetical protein